MWGTNTNGSIPGMEPKAVMDVPTKIDLSTFSEDNSVKQVVCGPEGTAILLENGYCYVSGTNNEGQLGVGHTQPVPEPTLLQWNTATDDDKSPLLVESIDIGKKCSALIDLIDGELYTFGSDGSIGSGMGFLGHGNGRSYTTPTLVSSLGEDGVYPEQVVVGNSHMTVLTKDDHEVLTTGAGSYGRLGNIDTHMDQLYFEPVEIFGTHEISTLAGGHSFTLALNATTGQLHAWGRNDKGQLGTGLGLAVDMYAMEAMPVPLEADELVGRRVSKVAAGHSHAACVTEGGELLFWGSGIYLEPYRVTTLLHTKIVDVACGQDYTLALDQEGKLYTFGKGKTGVLGQASVKSLNQPALVEALADKKILSINAGYAHAACLVEEEDE